MFSTRCISSSSRHCCWLAAAIVSLFPQTGLSQSSEDELALAFDEEMISIATGGQQSLSRAPAVATVITAKDIEAMGAQTLEQVLDTVPGVHASMSSIRFTPTYSIRGIYTPENPHVLMLINGIPMTQMWIGDRGPSSYPVADISRIEVIRGPGSAVYGADAFAGVINIITKSAEEKTGLQINALGGSFDTVDASILYGSKDNEYWGFDIAFSIEYYETEGEKNRIVESDAQSIFDAGAGTNASLAPGPVDTRQKWLDTRLDLNHDKLQFRIWNRQVDDAGVGPGVAQALDPTGRGDINNYLVDLTYHDPTLTKNIDFKTVVSYMDINTTSEQRLFPAGTLVPIGTDGNINPGSPSGVALFTEGYIGNPSIFETHTRIDLSAFFTQFDKHRIRVGAGALNAKVRAKETKNFGPGVLDDTNRPPPGPDGIVVVDGTTSDVSETEYAFYTSGERDVYYLSLQDEWFLASDWDLTAGVRYDDYSDFGNTINPRAALVWHPEYNMTTKLLYGRAFRPPSFAELFVKNNPTIEGNEDLKPEKIETVELVLDYQPTFDLHTTINTFYYEIDDLIEFVGGGTGTARVAENVGQQKGYGWEWEAHWLITDSWSIHGNYAWQRAKDKSTDSDVANVPQQQVYLQNRWIFTHNWHFNAQLSWIADRKRAQDDPRPEIDDYTLIDMLIEGKSVLPGLDLKFSVFNLLDEDARESSPYDPAAPEGAFIPGDYPLPGRSYYAGLSYRF
ncbi:TonB-dependent receptor plug domain-containing protein [Kaarinaea lacus]